MPFLAAHPSLLRALVDRGYTEPTPVQAAVLSAPPTADLLVSAQTGSGKTVAFGLAIAPTLLDDAERFVGKAVPQALVVAPTRELAMQVSRELTWLYAQTGARVVACVGGMDVRGQERELMRGAHIVVGTPGRLCDHLERGRMSFDDIKVAVLDEADEMLDMGFRDELERLLNATPKTRRTLMFSATLPKGIQQLAKGYQRDAVRLATAEEAEQHHDIEYRAVVCAPRERERAIVNILRYEGARGALLFCATREGVTTLCGNLLERGFSVVALSGELSQAERNRALHSLREGRAQVCVATDVAARGLDLPDLGLVIHADLPRDQQTLLHRSGRTGRAGRKGVCVLIVPAPARRLVDRILGNANISAQWTPPPSAEQVRARDQERIVADIGAMVDEAAEDDLAAAQTLLAAHKPETLVAALVKMQRGLAPAPEELTPIDDDGPRRAPSARPAAGDVQWFEIDVGRFGNADPRWMVPLLCRRGGITKAELGKIRIGARQSWFEVANGVAARFAEAAKKPDGKERHVPIRPAPHGPPPGLDTGGGGGPGGPRRPGPPPRPGFKPRRP